MNVALLFLLRDMRTGCSAQTGLEASPAHRAAPSWGCAWGHCPYGHASTSGTVPGRVAGVCCPQHPPAGTKAGSGCSANTAALSQGDTGDTSGFRATSTQPGMLARGEGDITP